MSCFFVAVPSVLISIVQLVFLAFLFNRDAILADLQSEGKVRSPETVLPPVVKITLGTTDENAKDGQWDAYKEIQVVTVRRIPAKRFGLLIRADICRVIELFFIGCV